MEQNIPAHERFTRGCKFATGITLHPDANTAHEYVIKRCILFFQINENTNHGPLTKCSSICDSPVLCSDRRKYMYVVLVHYTYCTLWAGLCVCVCVGGGGGSCIHLS